MLPVSKLQYPLFVLSSIHKRRYRKSHTLQFLKIPADMLCVVTGGKGMVRIQNQMVPLSPNQMFFLRPSMAMEVMLESDYADYAWISRWIGAKIIGELPSWWAARKKPSTFLDQMNLKMNYAREVLFQLIGNEKVSIMCFYYGKICVYGMIDHPLNHLLYKELGLKPGSCVPQHERSKEYNLRRLPPFETDHLLLYKHHVQPEDDAKFSALLASDAWSAMKAVRYNQIRLTPNWIGNELGAFRAERDHRLFA